MRRFLLALLCAALPTPAPAQTRPTVPADRPFQVLADHDGVNTSGYRVWICPGVVAQCSNAAVTLPASARASNGVVTYNAPALSRGTYSAQFEAFNADQASGRSASVAFDVVLPKPNTPSNVRFMVIETSADGRTTMKLLDVATLRDLLQLPPPLQR